MTDIVKRLRDLARVDNCQASLKAAAEITRLRIANIQMQAALGYAICAEDERHIMPTNPYRCGICDANKGLRDEITRLRAALELWHHAVKIDVTMEGPQYMGVSSILGRQAWERTRAALQQEVK